MASIADRNRDLLVERLQNDPRLGGAKVRAAAALMRVSVVALVAAGLAGALGGQLVFGEGGIQFGIGLAVGYTAYFGYRYLTMGEPRVIGVMAALTDKQILLLGSRKRGIVGEYDNREIKSLELLRKGNLLMMGKIGLTPADGEEIIFLSTNRRMGSDFVESFHSLAGRNPGLK